jgi:hypothetical protein
MGTGGLFVIFFAIVIYQLADKDNRRGWLWGGTNIAGAMLLSKLTGLGGFAVYLAFIISLIMLFWTNPLKRKR